MVSIIGDNVIFIHIDTIFESTISTKDMVHATPNSRSFISSKFVDYYSLDIIPTSSFKVKISQRGMGGKGSSSPHVIMIPHPIQGHVTPMLHLAELLSLADINVTFMYSTQVHQRLRRSTQIGSRFAPYPGFRFEAVSDGLPDDHPRNGQSGTVAVLQGFASNVEPIVREMLVGTKVTCLIIDGSFGFGHNVAKEADIPLIIFGGFCSAAYKWVCSCIPHLVDAGEMPFKDEDMDQLIQSIPDSILRYRDLPNFCRTKDKSTCQMLKQYFAPSVEQQTKQAHGLIINTFEDLEGPSLTHIRSNDDSKIYTIGPLHSHLKYRLERAETPSNYSSSSSLWEVDRSCLSWLDQKPDKSVVYVSFGSLAVLEREQLMEFWAGLVQSRKYFLWVIRPNLIMGSDSDLPASDELLQGTKERGCIVSWSPQEEVLAHPAIGGFLTHSGWNSILESITAGVPMLCWPYFAEQQVNSRYVSEVWKIGLDMKDVYDRNTVEKMVNDLVNGKKSELQASMDKVTDSALRSVSQGGSSYCNLDSMIEDIKGMAVANAL